MHFVNRVAKDLSKLFKMLGIGYSSISRTSLNNRLEITMDLSGSEYKGMSDHTHEVGPELALEERITLLQNHPLFLKLKSHEAKELAQLFKTIYIRPSTIIVHEGDPVDAIYLIVSGAAEVTRAVTRVGEDEIINVATLGKGDAIGLSQEGFFSQTGTRAGTVMSVLSMILLKISIHDFYHFIKKTTVIPVSLKDACENILLINFIKQTHIFSSLSTEQIQKIIEKKTKIMLPPNTIIFKEQDNADKCYFILSGKIDISRQGKTIATLEASHILGEGAFIEGGQRNATARTQVESELFVLDQEQIQQIAFELLKHGIDEKQIEQLKPTRYPDVTVSENKTPEDEIMITLARATNHAELQLSHRDYLIWQSLDGRATIESILKHHPTELQDMTVRDVYARVLTMANAGFLELEKKTLVDNLIKKIRLAW